tara:strand:- start:65228 stop:65851 length:624 start_codon:yes stop_codon:yes gene_type:complete
VDLSISQLADLVEHFKKQGFKGRPRRVPGNVAPSADRERLIRKIRALWVSLHCLGVLRDGSDTAMTAFAKRVTGGNNTGIANLAWLKGDAAYKVIEALKKMAERDAGVSWTAYTMTTQAGPQTVYLPRCRVLDAQWRTIAELKQAQQPDPAALAAYVRQVAKADAEKPLFQMRAEDQDRAIANLGEQIRARLDALGFETVQDWRKSR